MGGPLLSTISGMKLNSAPRCLTLWILAVFAGGGPLANAALPDLMVNAHRARSSVEFKRKYFSGRECAVAEGCVRGLGGRKLLLLDVGVANVGKGDLRLGDPNRNPKFFTWSGCHGHYHMKGLATYRILSLQGRQITKSYKQGFCLRDDRPVYPGGPAKYTCDFQGITSKWQDVYDKSLDCQWVDITGVPPGAYLLEITVNPSKVFAESNHRNNRLILKIYVPQHVSY